MKCRNSFATECCPSCRDGSLLHSQRMVGRTRCFLQQCNRRWMFPVSRLLRSRGRQPHRFSSTLGSPLGLVSRLLCSYSRSTVHRTREILPPHIPCLRFVGRTLARFPFPPARASPRLLPPRNLSVASTGLQGTSGPPRQSRHRPCELWNSARRLFRSHCRPAARSRPHFRRTS